jgi:hypothetical protein
MRALVFLFLLLLSLNLKAQYNKDAKHAIRLTPTFSGYHGLSLEAAYEYFIRPKHSVLLGLESNYRSRNNSNFLFRHISLNLGYRYNFLTWKKFEFFGGLDLKHGIAHFTNYENRELKSTFIPTSRIEVLLEANYNINKNFSIFGKVSTDLLKCQNCSWIEGIGIGAKYKF